ncbi:MAG: hypothetical protein IJ309_06900 [Clostridia bacterium]|nr:hypothetical protein [Clostridia bacterium]
MEVNSTNNASLKAEELPLAEIAPEISQNSDAEPTKEAPKSAPPIESEQNMPSSPVLEAQDKTLERFYKLIKDFFTLPNQETNPNDVDNSSSATTFGEDLPKDDLKKMASDPDFNLFRRSRGSEYSLSQQYKDYLELSASIEKRVTEQLLAKLATKRSSVGSLSSSERAEGDYFTKEQVLRMSEEQIRRNFDKIRQSQAKW